MKSFFVSMLTAGSKSISSKRFVGVFSWFVILGVFIDCSCRNTEAPECIYAIIIAASSLLGVDSVTNIWKGGKQNNQEQS